MPYHYFINKFCMFSDGLAKIKETIRKQQSKSAAKGMNQFS